MKIGIDISSLQGAHRMRGIGYTALNFLLNIPKDNKDYFVLYCDAIGQHDLLSVLDSLKIASGQYEIREFKKTHSFKPLPWKFRYLTKLLNKFIGYFAYVVGDSKYPNTRDLDSFLQLDQSKPLPKLRYGAKNYFVAYDLIPYVLESDYLWSYRTTRRHGHSRKAALKAAIKRYIYIQKLRFNANRAHKLLAISDTTKRDFVNYAHISPAKIEIITLGVGAQSKNDISNNENGVVDSYFETSWGYIPKQVDLKNVSFLLFVGGADQRRKLEDLVAAFNNLKAQGSDLQLVLSGDIMLGAKNIPSPVVRKALLSSSYKDDIHFVGFTDDITRNWLYQHAVAFVFPSVYEGFGLPVLEAMNLGSIVVTYKNSAVMEVAKNLPYYASDTTDLISAIREIQSLPEPEKILLSSRGIKHTSKFTWHKTATQILNIIR